MRQRSKIAPCLALTSITLLSCTSVPAPKPKLATPRVPAQPVNVTLTCNRMPRTTMKQMSGDWVLSVSDGGCTFPSEGPVSITATPNEMLNLNHRPQIALKIAPSGEVLNVSLIRTSGSTTLDQKAINEMRLHRYERNNCGTCRITTALNVEFDGPVWVRE